MPHWGIEYTVALTPTEPADARRMIAAGADLTFVGRRLVQVDLHPTLIIDGQPNLLEAAGGGNTVLDQVRKTSASLLGW